MDDFELSQFTTVDSSVTAKEVSPAVVPSRQALLVCIDVHGARNLFDPQTYLDKSSLWHFIALCVAGLAKNSIVVNQGGKFGLCLFGTDRCVNKYNVENVYEILELDGLSIDSIKSLENLESLDFDEFSHGYGSLTLASPAKMSTLFRYCLRTFRLFAAPTKFSRRLLLITHRDDPSTPADRSISLQLATDLISNHVAIEVVPTIVNPDDGFDRNVYFKSIIMQTKNLMLRELFDSGFDDDDDEELDSHDNLPSLNAPKCRQILSELQDLWKRKALKTRVIQRNNFRLARELVISVAVFLLVTVTKKPVPVVIKADDHAPLHSESRWIDTITGEVLAKDEIKRYYPIRDARVRITDEELDNIRANVPRPKYEDYPEPEDGEPVPRMTLMGFKPFKWLQRKRVTMKSQIHLIVPLEKEIMGSADVMQGLTTSMKLLKQVCIIGWQYRSNSPPRLYAGIQSATTIPGGIILIALPFAGEIRPTIAKNSESPAFENSDVEVEVLSKVLDEICITKTGFDPLSVRNPTLEAHHSGIQALALGYEELPVLNDGTKPSFEIFDLVKDDLEQLARLLGPSGKGATKRSAARASTPDLDLEHVRTVAQTRRLGNLTVVELKAALSNLGLQVSGRKSDLIERLTAYFSSTS